jgi:hypothetical protein
LAARADPVLAGIFKMDVAAVEGGFLCDFIG